MTNQKTQTKIIWRDVHGVLLLNKDLGCSSNRALQQVRRLFRAAKAGHTGSLDPLATGVLPICFGDATKYSSYLLDSDKEYIVTAQLGAMTSTGDLEGEVIASQPVPELNVQQLEGILKCFLGKTQQIPSMYSALKYNGQPLYKLARQGIDVVRQPRDIVITEISLLQFTGDRMQLRVKCSKGTYIRNLVEDIGARIGCGAHVVQLQRTAAGGFKLADAVTFAQLQHLQTQSELQDHLLLSVESLISDLPIISLSHAEAADICQGRVVAKTAEDGDFALFSVHSKFIGLGHVKDCVLRAKRLRCMDYCTKIAHAI